MSDTPCPHRTDPLGHAHPAVGRRTILRSAAALGGAAFVVGCGGDDDPATSGDTSSTSTSEPTSAPTSDHGGGGGAGTVLGPSADVPVGGGAIYPDEETVVTQPTQGDFKAFTAICTHRQCTVAEVTDTINCNCHGSMYSIEDGSVVGGPAPQPLAPKTVEVHGSDLVLS